MIDKINIETIGTWRDDYWMSKNVPIHKKCGGKIYLGMSNVMQCNQCGALWSDEDFKKAVDRGEVLI